MHHPQRFIALIALIALTLIPVATATADQPTAEPAAKPASEPSAEPASEPSAEPASEPSAEPAAEPAPATAAEPAPATAAEPAPATAAEPAPRPAVERDIEADEARALGAVISTAGGSYRAKARKSMLMPGGAMVLGGALSFLMSDVGVTDVGLDEGELKFTDVVFFHPKLRYSVKGKLELSIASTLLAKQPSTTNEFVLQSNAVGALIDVRDNLAMGLSVSGGPLLNSEGGWWLSGNLGFASRKSLDEVIILQGSLGGSGMSLFLDEDTEESFWFAEVAAHGEVLFQVPTGQAGAWVGVDFRFPVAHNPTEDDRDMRFGGFLDPQTRVNFQIGGVLSYLENWDLYAEIVIADRGEVTNRPTVLPILNGGFDQKVLIMGINRRYNLKNAPRMLIAQ